MRSLLLRVRGTCRRALAKQFARRSIAIRTSVPIISFTFDDAPITAFRVGGNILKSYGARGTYFVSLGLLGSETEVGTIASADDLSRAVKEGDELGCHTFDHFDAWHTSTDAFLQSVTKNQQALDRIIPGTRFDTFAYPKSGAKLSIKSSLEKSFICCRGGGQAANVGVADLNLLKACFLDKHTNVDMDFVKRLIDHNALNRGWLVFATHDVGSKPSPYGCTREFFGELVEYAVRSGASLLPLGEACRNVVASSSKAIHSS